VIAFDSCRDTELTSNALSPIPTAVIAVYSRLFSNGRLFSEDPASDESVSLNFIETLLVPSIFGVTVNVSPMSWYCTCGMFSELLRLELRSTDAQVLQRARKSRIRESRDIEAARADRLE
jgi:hypothetical protein